MSLRIFKPTQTLAPYVESFWDYDDLTGDENAALSILPDTASYTSDEGGIRHAMLEEPNIGYDEAKYMAVACSAFVNFIAA